MLIGTDRSIFQKESSTRRRISLLGNGYIDVIDSIVFSTRAHGISTSQKVSNNVHIHPTQASSRFLYIFNAYRVAKKLPRPDIVSAQDPFETGIAAYLIARYWRVPFVVEMHTDFFSPSFSKTTILNRVRVYISKFILKRASSAYVVSEKIKHTVSEKYKNLPLSVMPIYVNVDRYAALTHRQHPRFKTALLWVGRMEKEKDPMLALHSFIEARKKGFDAGITFVGSGTYLETLKSEAQNAGVAEWVECVGNQLDLRPYYEQADLLLVTSKYEGYGMVIVEALAAGVPVLSTDVGIAREAGAHIVEGEYTHALGDWLTRSQQSKPRGVLKLHSYMNEDDYFKKTREYYETASHILLPPPMKRIFKILLWALFLFIAVAAINPNPFGNSPDIIGDESYFLTSSLSAIEKHTLPGWEFSRSGNYYGGVQTYIDTIVLVPALGIIYFANNFSILETKLTVAMHTGDLLALLRFVNGLFVVVCCGFFIFLFVRRRVPRAFALQMLFLLFLLLGNSLIVGFVHTAKVWTFNLLLDVTIGILFLAQEYYLSRRGEVFIRKELYIACLVWAIELAFFQTYVGAFSLLLWMIYALLLRHISLRDIWLHVRRNWYYLVGFGLLQLSFLYRAAFVKSHSIWWDPGDVAVRTVDSSVDWFHRLYNPIAFAVSSQPFLILYGVGLVSIIFLGWRNKWYSQDVRKRMFIMIACLHPLIAYGVMHVLFGFSLFPRYALTFSVALSFATVMLLEHTPLMKRGALALCGLLFMVINLHAMSLYWKPASDVLVTQMLRENYNSSQNVFILEREAFRLNLPLNDDSLALLNERRKNMSRFQFLLQYPKEVASRVTFTPRVLMADSKEEEALYHKQMEIGNNYVWSISTHCNALCTPAEEAIGMCFTVNREICGFTPQEIHTLKNFMSFERLGDTYTVRRTK